MTDKPAGKEDSPTAKKKKEERGREHLGRWPGGGCAHPAPPV